MRNTRDSHAALNGVAIPEDEKFRTIWGNELRYPGDPSAPAAEIINCHCVLIPGVLMPGENADARLKNAPKSDIIKGEERVETAPEKAAAIEKEFRYTDAWGPRFLRRPADGRAGAGRSGHPQGEGAVQAGHAAGADFLRRYARRVRHVQRKEPNAHPITRPV